jgi:GNAT superfamily N-acetyltransferase
MTKVKKTLVNLKVSFVPFTSLLNPATRNDFFRFTSWIDEQHGDKWATTNVFQTLKAFNNPLMRMMTMSVCDMTWYIVLKRDDKVVSVALYQKGMEITTLTTAKDERKKGYASYLMRWLGDMFARNNVKVICPAEKRILPVLAKAGWTIAEEFDNPDGTVDTMPEYVKEEYLRTTKCKPMRSVNERSMVEVIEFLEFLKTKNKSVPEV